MKLLCKLIICVLPFPLVGLVFLKAPLGPVWGPAWSIILSCLAVLIWRLLSAWQGIAAPRVGSPIGLLRGMGIGIVLTTCSVIAMGIVRGYPFEIHPPSRFEPLQWLAQQVRAACLEETFMRGGTVHFLAAFFGTGWAYLGGSLPFALMHFWQRRFSYGFLVGTCSAGLMLSAVYLEYGLLAAIGVHLAWNVLSRFFIEILDWGKLGGTTSALEGAWTTTLILLIATAAIVTVSRKRKPAGQQQSSTTKVAIY